VPRELPIVAVSGFPVHRCGRVFSYTLSLNVAPPLYTYTILYQIRNPTRSSSTVRGKEEEDTTAISITIAPHHGATLSVLLIVQLNVAVNYSASVAERRERDIETAARASERLISCLCPLPHHVILLSVSFASTLLALVHSYTYSPSSGCLLGRLLQQLRHPPSVR